MRVVESGIGELIQAPDMNAFREWNRTQKSRKLIDKRMTEAEAVSRFVYDGCYIGTELYGTVRCPMSLVREVVRQGVRDLRVAGQGVTELDLWLAAGIINALDITYIGLEVYGVSNALRREVESGRLSRVVEWSNAGISWRFKATALGAPFIPVRSMLGTDTLKYSAAKVVECPFTGEKLALLPALILDVGLMHVHRADRYGNCQVEGITGFGVEFARACKRLIISAEEIIDTDEIRRYPDRTIVPYYLVDAVVHAPFGSHPGEMAYRYCRDEPEIKAWVEASATEEGASAYLQEWIHDLPDHQAYLAKVGEERLERVVDGRERRE
ncbi:MAG: CoA transferase subunit A [Anaerolineae bacterium]|jgi:acyl CoA:acetate/3-ketoacid CoA transferase alpha subunit|nr:CoA transferase subunit A [Anaerolineae bacterium]MDX9829724.1 CoA-transferase [Anaerolineae bacterium]